MKNPFQNTAKAAECIGKSNYHPDFEFTTHSKGDATHFIFGAEPDNVICISEYKDSNKGHFIKCSDEIAEHFRAIDWREFGVDWFNKTDLLFGYDQVFFPENV